MSAKTIATIYRWFQMRFLVPICLGMILSCLMATSLAQDKPPDRKTGGSGFPDLVAGLKATPGCLGVETARTQSGKNVIFAWFENERAVLKWYYSDMHQGVIKKFFPEAKPGEPLEGVPDNSGPILAIAAITMADKPQFEGTSLPISQISIELYQPVRGGIFLGSRFAPDSLKVPGMRDLTPKKQ